MQFEVSAQSQPITEKEIMLASLSTIQDIDRNIDQKRKELRALEQAKAVLTSVEPMSASSASNAAPATAPKRGPGRPRRAGTQTRTASAAKRGPGRPRTKAKGGKKRGPGRPKGSKNKDKTPDAPAITPGAAPAGATDIWAETPAQQ